LLKRKAEIAASLSPQLNERELENKVYEFERRHEATVREQLEETMSRVFSIGDQVVDDKYNELFNGIVAAENEIGESKLAEYVVHRNVMLRLFDQAIRADSNSKFAREEVIHKLIYPMRATSDDTNYDNHNLWIIDEKLSFHSFLASDKQLSKEEQSRPDLLILDNTLSYSELDPPQYGSVLLVEFKRPERDGFNSDENPVRQVYEYIERLKEGKAKTSDLRTINLPKGTNIFAYIISDLTPSLKKVLFREEFKESGEEGRYYKFHTGYQAYLEVMSYDTLLDIAKRRNQILFKKLGLPLP
jgi:hypothetical protein